MRTELADILAEGAVEAGFQPVVELATGRVIGWEALVEAGSYAAARDTGTLRTEGRDYVMADGDVITVKFTP